ncbi:MAG: dTDP-glucose 4,6-dehydratase [Gammaproteobacteria bacterium]
MSFSPRCVLVTGGAGFIGGHFIRGLLSGRLAGIPSPPRVVNLDALSYAAMPQRLADLDDNPGYRFVQGDVRDAGLVSDLLRGEHIDAIVHLAAESHVDRSIAGPDAFIQTNLLGTFTLLEAARTAWLERGKPRGRDVRFLQVSTDEVFGSLSEDSPAFREGDAYAPNSPYSASKAGADHLVRAYHQTYGLPVLTSRCSNNYGPGQHAEKLVPTVIRACQRRQAIPIYGDGSNRRDWLHVEDHCRALWSILTRGEPGESYNVGGGTELSNLEMARRICDLMDRRQDAGFEHASLIAYVEDRKGHDWRYAIDASKLRGQLSWEPLVSFETGLAETVHWYLNAPE